MVIPKTAATTTIPSTTPRAISTVLLDVSAWACVEDVEELPVVVALVVLLVPVLVPVPVLLAVLLVPVLFTRVLVPLLSRIATTVPGL